ncbi:MAG: GNAT family N-acetyltransferase [Myxococcales bacterium]|nr:GNAT family N-acetyltransferase [Myxococcales bacterium]
MAFRAEVVAADLERVRGILGATGFFSAEEIEVAVELCQAAIDDGDATTYPFLFAEVEGEVVGYACFGHIPGTRASYDLYWIAVAPHTQRRGVGGALLGETERRIATRGGDRVYVETSSRPQYDPTRAFYEHHDYLRAAFLEDYYAPGDGKIIYVKQLGPRGD